MPIKWLVSLVVVLGLVGLYCCAIFLLIRAAMYTDWGFIPALAAVVVFLGVSIVLHLLLVRTGQVVWWSVAAGWLLCLLPAYIHCFWQTSDGLVTFLILCHFVIGPPFVVSLVMALVQLIRQRLAG